jgi:hypothetical protein
MRRCHLCFSLVTACENRCLLLEGKFTFLFVLERINHYVNQQVFQRLKWILLSCIQRTGTGRVLRIAEQIKFAANVFIISLLRE